VKQQLESRRWTISVRKELCVGAVPRDSTCIVLGGVAASVSVDFVHLCDAWDRI
jgi:hypothetical protein